MSYVQADKEWEANNTLGDTRDDSARGDKLGRAKATITVPAAGIAVGSYSTTLDLPKGAIVKETYYKVRTTFTSAGDTATIGLGIEAAGDVFAPVAIGAAADWDAAAPVQGLQDGAIGNWLECSATERRTLDYVVGVQDLTAGEMDVWVEWEF